MDDSPSHEIWSDWGANQRDLFILDKNGDFFCKINLTSGFNADDILNKIQFLDWNTTAHLETELAVAQDGEFEPGSTHGLSITVFNNSAFNAHYAGYHLSSSSANVTFSNSDNWAYVIGAEDSFTDYYTSFTISNDCASGEEITIYSEPSIIDDCSDSCSSCDTNCIVCPQGGVSSFTFTVGQVGDINQDGTVNVLDVVLLVNYALNSEWTAGADINDDGVVNILDVVLLVNTILG